MSTFTSAVPTIRRRQRIDADAALQRGPEISADRKFADVESLTPVMCEVFGTDRRIDAVARLPNGTKKGVYRVTLDDATSAIVYVWNADEDYWDGLLPDGHDDPSNPFAHASGIEFFEGPTRRLEAVGARSPRLSLADRSRDLYPADIAVAEDVRGGTLEALLERDPDAGRRTLSQLSDMLRRMHAYRAPAFGRVAWIDGGGAPRYATCEQAYLEHALVNIATAVPRDARAAEGESMLEEKLRTLHAALEPHSNRAQNSAWSTASSARNTRSSGRTGNPSSSTSRA